MEIQKEKCYKDSWITGEVHDVIIDKDGNRTVMPVSYNLVVHNCSVLIAALFKGLWSNSDSTSVIHSDDEDKRSGIRYWAIGTGNNEGDATAPEDSDTKLQREVYRQRIQPSQISFVVANSDPDATGVDAYITSDSPTNQLRLQIIVDYDQANMDDSTGAWTEFGIFAGPDATSALNSGVMMNRKTHPPISKTDHIKVERTLIFTF